MSVVTLDFTRETGRKIKPLHGLNSGPANGAHGHNSMEYYRAAAIPYARLHDIAYPYGSGHYVDIHCVFPDFFADPENPGNYDFALTDDYIRNIADVGGGVIYRLGCTIEHQSKKYYTHPPKDYLQWAKICAGIVRHYMHGWADGFFYSDFYWEIWNEPDLFNNNPMSTMWSGTDEQYYELYRTAAVYLKDRFPEIRIGGPAAAVPDSPFIEGMLKALTADDRRTPLDFLSWHTYASDPGVFRKTAGRLQSLLLKYGYGDTEQMLNEWNYVIGWKDDELITSYRAIESMKGAAFNTAVLCELQQSPVAVSAYYGSESQMCWSGCFDRADQPLKSYYAFRAFGRLYRMGRETESTSDTDGIYVCAANGEGGSAALLVNWGLTDRQVTVKLKAPSDMQVTVAALDDARNMEPCQSAAISSDGELTLQIAADTVRFLEFTGR